mgnify:CR=1 FL=1|tara:strand:- start:69 stop:461 length:393 start_codon:yes stop_codon:yes gene_type:complete
MKKLILISALLFSFNGWADEDANMIYLSCINEEKVLERSLTPKSTENDFIIIDLEKMLLSSKVAFEWKMAKNNSYYTAEYLTFLSRQTYILNRITLELRLTIAQLNDSGKPDLTQPVASIDYQCERTERI